MAKRIRGSGRVFQRGNRWWIAFYSAGRELREPGGDTARHAQALLTDRLAALGRGEPVTPAGSRITVRAILDAHLTALEEKGAKAIRPARCHAANIAASLGDIRVARLTPDLIRRHTKDRLVDAEPGTVHTELAILTAALNRARKEGVLAFVPFIPKPPVSPARQGFVEPAAFAAVLGRLRDPYADAAAFAYATGWRKTEIAGLTWAQVFRREGEIRLGTTKNGRPRTIPLAGEIAALVERRAAVRMLQCPLVFHVDGKRMGATFLRAFKTAAGAAGYPALVLHDLRRSGVRNLVRAGVREDVAMTISGHESREVFRRYNVTSTTDQTSALIAADAYRARRGSPRENTDKNGENTDNPSRNANES